LVALENNFSVNYASFIIWEILTVFDVRKKNCFYSIFPQARQCNACIKYAKSINMYNFLVKCHAFLERVKFIYLFFCQKNGIFFAILKGVLMASIKREILSCFNLYRCKYLLGCYRGSMSMWKIFPTIYRFILHLTLSLMFKRFQ